MMNDLRGDETQQKIRITNDEVIAWMTYEWRRGLL